MSIKTIKVDVLIENGTIRYIDRKEKREIGIYETYFFDRKTTTETVISSTLELVKEQSSDSVGESEIVLLDDDSDSLTLALISKI